MLEQIKYVNHKGETIHFGKDGIFANENDLRNYAWSYDSNRNRIENFRKGVANKAIPITIASTSEEEAVKIKNRIFEVFEKDVIAEQPGRFYINEYYMECYIVESAKSAYLQSNNSMKVSAKIVSVTGNWILETYKEFIYVDGSDETGRGYPYRYPYDYSAGEGNFNELMNNHFSSCDFVIKISGYAHQPSITIGDHIYQINETIQANEILTIDSRSKTIILTRNNGVQVSLFSKREKSSYIFEKIPSGMQKVYWNSGFNWEITLYEERSEPKWT